MKYLDLDGLNYYNQFLTNKLKNKFDNVAKTYVTKDIAVSNISISTGTTISGVEVNLTYADTSSNSVNIPNATSTDDGAMSHQDKTKLNSIPTKYIPTSDGVINESITINESLTVNENIIANKIYVHNSISSDTNGIDYLDCKRIYAYDSNQQANYKVWNTNGGITNLLDILTNAAIYVHGDIVENITNINLTITIDDPDAIIFNKATGGFVAKKGNGYYRYWNVIDNLLISTPDTYGVFTAKRGIVPCHKQLYTFANDNHNIYVADNTGSVPVLNKLNIN